MFGVLNVRLKKILFSPVIIIAIIVFSGSIETEPPPVSLPVSLNVAAAASGPGSGTDVSTAVLETKPIIPESPAASDTAPDEPELVAYEGPVRHIFFHPLILFPERAFRGTSLSKGFNDWFVTVPEFSKILESIYENDFILVSMDSVCGISEQNGVKIVQRNKLFLPKGKKPLIISIDDLNYYDYMINNGCASRLYFDSQGHTAVEYREKDGTNGFSYDDIVPMVDEFVRRHPDFSFNGAKGIIALTGYEGILGYRTNETDSPGYEADKTLAGALVKMLKEDGWSFACHGYGHLDAAKVSIGRFEKDCERWKKEVAPLTGETPVYIYPYGSALKPSDKKFKLLKDNGFAIFCGVGPDGAIEFKGDYAYLERKNVDGLTISGNSRYLKDLFDCSQVLDPIRPGEY